MSAPDDLRQALTGLVDEAPAHPDRLAAVHRRASSIRRRRRVAAATAVAAVVAVVAVSAAATLPGHRSAPVAPLQPPAKLPASVLLVDPQGHLLRLPGMSATRLTSEPGTGLRPNAHAFPVADGRVVTFDRRGDILVMDPAHPGEAHVLLPVVSGQPGRYRMPDDRLAQMGATQLLIERGGRRVWVPTVPLGTRPRQMADAAVTLVPLDLAGRPAGEPITFPQHEYPIVVGKAGLFAFVPNLESRTDHGYLVRMDPDPGHVGAATVVARDVQVDPFAANYGEAVVTDAVQTSCDAGQVCGHPRLLDADTGRSVPLQGGTYPGDLTLFLPAISVDGRYLATDMMATLPLRSGQGNDFSSGTGWAVIDSRTGHVTAIRQSIRYNLNRTPLPSAVWSGDRLIWTGWSRHGTTRIGAYLPDSGRSVVTTVPAGLVSVVGAS